MQNLKKIADYSSKDADGLNTFLQNIGPEYCIYTYSMLNAGVDKTSIRSLNDEQLERECAIKNSIHRLRILNSIKSKIFCFCDYHYLKSPQLQESSHEYLYLEK